MHLVVSAAVAGTAAVATTIVAAPPSLAASGENDSAEASNFEKELARQRSDVAALKAAWEYSGKAEKIPSRAWPDVQPEPEEIPALAEELKARCGGGRQIAHPPGPIYPTTALIFQLRGELQGKF